MARIDDVVGLLRSIGEWLNTAQKGSVTLDFAGSHLVMKVTRIDEVRASPTEHSDATGEGKRTPASQ